MKKYTLKEDIADEVASAITTLQPEIAIVDSEPSKTEVDKALASLIKAAINREFDTLDNINSDIATIKAESPEKTDVINILETIATEKNIHVGMLTKALSLVDNESQNLMNAGIEKAEEIISEPATQDLNN